MENKTPFLVMDYASNGSLRKRYPRGTRLPSGTIVGYVKQVADALQYAHNEKVIHRDIKPENMLLGRYNEVLLSDFGIALIAQSSRSQSTQDIVGTITYMAPEHIQGKPRLVSDQYSLGIVVYEWICGDRPFHGSFTELCTQHMFASPPSLHMRVPGLPPAVEEVVLTSLAKDPKERFGSVKAFATAFEQACRPIRSYPISPNSEIAAPSRLSPPSDAIAAIPPSQLVRPKDIVTPLSQPLQLANGVTPSVVPAVSHPPSEAKPPSVFSSSTNFSPPFPPAATLPTAEAILPVTNKVSSSFYNTPFPVQLPMPKKYNGWKVAVACVSILLIVALLFVLVPYLGQLRIQTINQASTRTTSQSPTSLKTATPLPPKFIYVISDLTNNGKNTGEVVSAVQISDGKSLWQSLWNNESSYAQPIVLNGVVYFSTIHFNSSTGYGDGGAIHALRASDGSTLWTYHIASQNGANGINIADGVVYTSADALYALRASDGSLLWKYQVTGEYISVPQSVVNGIIYTVASTSSNSDCFAYALRASDGPLLLHHFTRK